MNVVSIECCGGGGGHENAGYYDTKHSDWHCSNLNTTATGASSSQPRQQGPDLCVKHAVDGGADLGAGASNEVHKHWVCPGQVFNKLGQGKREE